jgi:hypothetical protein
LWKITKWSGVNFLDYHPETKPAISDWGYNCWLEVEQSWTLSLNAGSVPKKEGEPSFKAGGLDIGEPLHKHISFFSHGSCTWYHSMIKSWWIDMIHGMSIIEVMWTGRCRWTWEWWFGWIVAVRPFGICTSVPSWMSAVSLGPVYVGRCWDDDGPPGVLDGERCVGTTLVTCTCLLTPLAITRHHRSQLTRPYRIPSRLKTSETTESDRDIISIAPRPNPNFQQGSRLERSTISASQGKTTSYNRLQREQVSFDYPFTKIKYGLWDAQDGVLL